MIGPNPEAQAEQGAGHQEVGVAGVDTERRLGDQDAELRT